MQRKELLEDMLKYSVYYKNASKGIGYTEEINRKLKQLSYIGSMVCMPFYLSFLTMQKKKYHRWSCLRSARCYRELLGTTYYVWLSCKCNGENICPLA